MLLCLELRPVPPPPPPPLILPLMRRFSGADLAGLVREAAMQALRRGGPGPSAAPLTITQRDFVAAMGVVRPSVSKEEEAVYRSSKK